MSKHFYFVNGVYVSCFLFDFHAINMAIEMFISASASVPVMFLVSSELAIQKLFSESMSTNFSQTARRIDKARHPTYTNKAYFNWSKVKAEYELTFAFVGP